MNLYLVNESTVIPDADVAATLAPLTIYSRHIRSWWGSMQPGIFMGAPKGEAWQIVIADDSDQAGALGYHDMTDGGRPIAYVFAKTGLENGYDWQVTLTHEFAEMLLDPYIRRGEQTADTRWHALELCDPVEADELAYVIQAGGHSLRCSDFVTPAWFWPWTSGLRYDHLGHTVSALEVLPGGYAYVYEDGDWYAEDHAGAKSTVAEFASAHPEKTRLELYARPFPRPSA
jgi:hypothetical protein